VVTARCPPCDVRSQTSGLRRHNGIRISDPYRVNVPRPALAALVQPVRVHAVCLHWLRRAVFPDPYVGKNRPPCTVLIGFVETAGDPFQLGRAPPRAGVKSRPVGLRTLTAMGRAPFRPNSSPATPRPTESASEPVHLCQSNDGRTPDTELPGLGHTQSHSITQETPMAKTEPMADSGDKIVVHTMPLKQSFDPCAGEHGRARSRVLTGLRTALLRRPQFDQAGALMATRLGHSARNAHTVSNDQLWHG
jgi:hypothetical protein